MLRSETIRQMCYFCHTLGNNAGARPHKSENCRDARNSHSKKAHQPQASLRSSGGQSAGHGSHALFESCIDKSGLAGSAAAAPRVPPLFFLQTECGRYVDSSLPHGLVLADHQSRAFHGQLFSIATDGVITDATTQRVLDCREATRGSTVALANRSGSSTQRWSICADGSVRLQDAALCLDVRGGKMTALSPLIVWAPHGKANQRFRIVSDCADGLSAVLLTRAIRLLRRFLLKRSRARGQAAALRCTQLNSRRATRPTAACNASQTAVTVSAASVSPPPPHPSHPSPL